MVVWEANADFQPSQVHKQTAIWFKPPRYHKLDITEPVHVYVQLQRPSDNATSEPANFQYLPLDSGRPALWSIRRNLAQKSNYNLLNTLLANDMQLLAKRQTIPQMSFNNNGNQSGNMMQQPAKNLISVGTNTFVNLHKTISVQTEREVIHPQMEVVTIAPDSSNLEPSYIQTDDNIEERTFNEIMKEVVELDEIYADTQARLAELNDTLDELPITNQNKPILMQNESFDDTKTYSSLQLAFKNPLQIREKFEEIVPLPPSRIDDEKLPPLPPKRIRRGGDLPTMSRFITDIDTPASNLNLTNSNPNVNSDQKHLLDDNRNFSTLQRPRSHGDLTMPPTKNLPPTPCSTLPNPKKRSFFSKIFSRKKSNDSSSRHSLTGSKSLLPTTTNLSRTPSNVSAHSNTNSVHIPLKDTPPNSVVDNLNKLNDDNVNLNLDIDMSMDLTEAEHYALYTTVAPHATQSEFDETSCYYAPVEGGKILTDTEEFFLLNNNNNNNNKT